VIDLTVFEQRVAALRDSFEDAGIDGMLVTHPTNRRYLTGFTADDTPPNESSGHLVISREQIALVTGSVNITQAEAQSPHVRVVNRETSWAASNSELIQEFGISRIGYESDAILESVFRTIGDALARDDYRYEWVVADGLVETFRSVKSPDEIELLRKAFEITVETFETVAPTISAGQTEAEIAWRIHQTFVELGAEGPAFPTIVAAGTHAARPHHEPGAAIIESGQSVIIDMGAKYEGYCADLTRTIWIGTPDPRLQDVYPVVAQAVEEVFERLAPGVSCQDLDGIAREYIERHGYGDAFTHSLGHGVGLRVHEGPSANRRSKDVLVPGNTLTIEPGAYFPDWGGVRVEDVILVTEDGFEVLTTGASKMRMNQLETE
jgi:Xaa-Pro aminopeptidase